MLINDDFYTTKDKFNLGYNILCLLCSVFFAFFLANLPIDQFVDRNNYITYSTYPAQILMSRLNNGFVSFIFNEPVWIFINLFLSSVFSPENVIRIIIFFSVFSTFYLVLKNNSPKYLLFLLAFLLLPQVLKNNVIHLRQGLAIAFFLWGWFSKKKSFRCFFIIISALIHTSFIIVVFGISLVVFFSSLKVSNGVKNLIYVLVGVAVSFFGLIVASSFGARQAEKYSVISANISGLGFVFWSGVLFLYLSQGKAFIEKNTYSIFFLFLYLATYFSFPVTGRVLESVLLMILLSSLDLKEWKKILFIIVYIVFFVLNWSIRIGQPWFGWGVSNY